MASNYPMKKNTACSISFPIFDGDGDLVPNAAGLDSEYSVDEGAFADCTNEAIEIEADSGMYCLDLVAAETNGDRICIIVKTTTTGAKTTPLVFYPSAQTLDEMDTIIDAEVVKTAAIKVKTDALPSGMARAEAIAAFPFMMVLSADHLTPATGKAVLAFISKDGGAFAATTTAAATEIANGFYYIPLTATEMTAKTIALKFTNADCDQRSITLVTSDIA
jgi:hypothetical protein